jgi:hypothetical protein
MAAGADTGAVRAGEGENEVVIEPAQMALDILLHFSIRADLA